MIPAAISHMQASSFRTEIDIDGDVMESTSTHPCHRLSIPAARLFWCRHCMQIFEDPITRWRHSKTCLHSSSGKVRKDKDGSTMQVFLSANNLSALRREQNRSRVISRSVGPGHSPGTDLRCFICKMTFVSIEEMRVHVRNPCRKRPTIAVPKHKYSALPAEIKTQIQIPDTASEIIYIKDGHQTVISLESPCTAEVLKTELVEPSQEYEPDNVSGTEEVFIFPDTFDSTTNLNAIERTVEISAVETVVPFASKTEEVTKQPKNRKENKENNVRKRKRILPKEVDDRPNHKTSNSPKSDQQIAFSLPTKPDDAKDVLDDFEAPPIKISKMTNKDPEDETSQATVRAKPLQTNEEFSQLLIAEKDNQSFLGGEHLPNGVVTEQVTDEAMLLKALASPVEKIVTGAAAEARLKDLFTTMEMQNKTKLYPFPKQTKTVSTSPKSLGKTGSPTNIRNDDIDKCQNDGLEKDERQLSISQEEEIDTAGLLLYMPPINAGSVTLPDPLLDLQSGLPAEMLLDETTNTNPPIPTAPEVITAFVPSDIMEETKLPSHIFDGDLLPSQIHSEVLFEEIIDEKENPLLVDNRLVEELVSAETNLEEAVKIESPVGINEVEGEIEEFTPVGEITTVVEVGPPTPKHPEENQEIPLEESELEQVKNEESALPIAESLEMSNQTAEANPAEKNAEMKTKDEAEEGEASIAEKTEIETKHKSTKLFKCKACSNIFKTSQALQKHSRVPCKIKHTRSLSQKILRPKQPCLKIEKKPMKKKMVKPMRRPKLMIPIIPITRSELIRPAVPRRPRRFSRRRRKKCFFSDEQKRILPFVNVLMSELSDKDRFFYKLGMINQCRKIPSSETTTSTAPNSEAPAVEMLGDSAEQSSLKLQFPGIKTESTYPPEIAPLSPAEVVAAEPQRISYSASPAVAAACVSDQENPCALAKGLCLSLPTLEKMEDNQFHDPNCISPSHVKPEPPDPPRDSSGVTGQSVQSPCWEAAPHDPNCISPSHVKPEPPDPPRDSSEVIGQSVQSPCWEAAPDDPNCISPSHVKPEPHDPPRDSSGVTGQSVQSLCWEAAPDDPNCISPSHVKPEPHDPPRDSSGVTGQSVQSPCWEDAPHDHNCISPSHVKPEPHDPPRDSSGVTGQSVQSPCWEAAPDDPNCISPSHVKPEPHDPPRDSSGVTGQSVQSPCWEDAPHDHNCISPSHVKPEPHDPPRDSSGVTGQSVQSPCWEAAPDDPNCISPSHVKPEPHDPPRDSSGVTGQSVQSPCWEDAPHDHNCISPSHVKPEPHDPPRDSSGVTGQSVQSPCWEAAPRLAQLPGMTQIVRVTSANPSSADLLNGIDTNKPSVTHESDQSNILANGKSFSLANSSPHCKTQSKVMVNDSNLNISSHLAAKNLALKWEESEEPLGNVFQNSASQPETISASLQELSIKEESCSDAVQKDSTNLAANNPNKKIRPNSVSKVKIQRTKGRKKAGAKSKKQLRKGKILSPDNTNTSHSSVNKNSTKFKLNVSRAAKHKVIKPINPTKNHNRINERNQKQTDSCTGANIKMRKKKHRSVDSSISNSQKRISSSLSRNVTSLSSKKVTSNRNSAKPASSCKKVASSQESYMATITLCKKVASSQESPMATTTLCKKVASSLESHMATTTLCKKVASSQESPMATTTLCKKVASSQESQMATTTLCKKVASSQESPMATTTLCKKVASSQESQMATTTLCKKVASNQESHMATTTLCKKVASSQESPMATTALCKKVASSQESPMATTALCKKVASSQESQMATTTLCKKVDSSQESHMATTALCKKVASSQESPIAATALCKKVASSQESHMATTTLCKKVASSQESPIATTTLCKKVASSQESQMATTTLCKKVASSQESHMATTTLCKKVASSQESPMATTTLCKKLASCWNSTMPTSSSSSKQRSLALSKKTESNPGTPLEENRNLVSVKIENCSESGLSNDQNRTSPICPPSAITSPLSSKAVCSGGSDSVSDQARPNPLSLCQSKTLAHQMQEDRIGQPVIKRENNLEQPLLKDTVVQPMLKSLCIDVFEETLKNLSDANNERQRHFSDIFGHEKVCLEGEDSNANYQISPSKERSKRHFTDFLCAFSEEASAPRVESTAPVHSGFSQEKIKSIKIEEPNLSEYLKTNETFAKSASLNQEERDVKNIISPHRDSEDSQKSSGIGCSNILQVAEIPAVSCLKQNNREFGNEQFVRMMESPDKSVLKNEKLKEDIKPFPISGECHSESHVTELLSGESLLNSGSSDPHKTEATAVVTISNTAVTTLSSCSGNNSIVTNSSPVEYQTPFQNSETPFNLSTTATSNPRVSIATQTDSSFLKETKTELSVPSCSCDNVEKNEPPPVSFNPDPSPPLPSSTTTNNTPTPTPVDDIPPTTVLSKEEISEELVQEDMNLDTSALPLPPEIVINDNHLSPVSPSPETTCSPVQGERGLQENTEVSVLLQQSVPAPSTVATESPRQQLVLDNMTDPNVLVQYLNSLDPSILPQEVTFVIIQGMPGEPLHVTDDHNFIIEQTAFSEHAEQESANSSVIYTLQPQSDIATEAECIMTDSS